MKYCPTDAGSLGSVLISSFQIEDVLPCTLEKFIQAVHHLQSKHIFQFIVATLTDNIVV